MNELARQIGALIAARIKQLRARTVDEYDRPLSQRQFAQRVGVSHATIANVEGGKQYASLQLLYAIATNLGEPLSSLLPSVEEVEAAVPRPSHTNAITKMLPEWGKLITAQ